MRAYVEAYGCTLNIGESREFTSLLEQRGWDLVSSPECADLAVLVTCVVIDKTEQKMLKRVSALRGTPRFLITGCMATACRERAEAIAPGAEFVPPGDIESFARVLGPGTGNGNARPAPHSYPFAIVPISTGCLGGCAYCITRLARGHLRSSPADVVVEKVRESVSRGPIEVRLTAQDTAAYGADNGTSFPELVERLCAIQGDFRIRIGMMNPASALRCLDGIERMYLEPKVFKFIHLPVQSGSDSILARMSRGYRVEDFDKIVSRLRSSMPEVSLSTDLIVGYPGETDQDHRENLELISRTEPDIVNVTRFSGRPGTAAARDPDRVVGWKQKDRSREITRLRFSIALRRNRGWVGRSVRALSTEPGKPGTTIFRTEEYRQIVVPGRLKLGDWSTVRVTGATATYLSGVREGPG